MEGEQRKAAGEKVFHLACRFGELSLENAALKGAEKEAGRKRKYEVEKLLVQAVEKYQKLK